MHCHSLGFADRRFWRACWRRTAQRWAAGSTVTGPCCCLPQLWSCCEATPCWPTTLSASAMWSVSSSCWLHVCPQKRKVSFFRGQSEGFSCLLCFASQTVMIDAHAGTVDCLCCGKTLGSQILERDVVLRRLPPAWRITRRVCFPSYALQNQQTKPSVILLLQQHKCIAACAYV